MSKRRRQYIYNLQLSDSEGSLNVKEHILLSSTKWLPVLNDILCNLHKLSH